MKHALIAGSVMQVLRQQAGVWSLALVAGVTGCAAQGSPTVATQAPAKTTTQGWRQLGYFVLVDGTIGVTVNETVPTSLQVVPLSVEAKNLTNSCEPPVQMPPE